jgi:hypothetical protein
VLIAWATVCRRISDGRGAASCVSSWGLGGASGLSPWGTTGGRSAMKQLAWNRRTRALKREPPHVAHSAASADAIHLRRTFHGRGLSRILDCRSPIPTFSSGNCMTLEG